MVCTIMVKQYLGKNAESVRITKDQLIRCPSFNKKMRLQQVYDLEVYCEVCRPPQHFEFAETELPCRFIWLEKFPWLR